MRDAIDLSWGARARISGKLLQGGVLWRVVHPYFFLSVFSLVIPRRGGTCSRDSTSAFPQGRQFLPPF